MKIINWKYELKFFLERAWDLYKTKSDALAQIDQIYIYIYIFFSMAQKTCKEIFSQDLKVET